MTTPRQLMIGAFGLAVAACSQAKAPPRQLRAHTRYLQTIAHADPAANAGHYCAYCHGAALQGGAHGEPSCYTCHGVNWLDTARDADRAPADHTVANKGFRHKLGLFAPAQNCVACHGGDLTGDVTAGQGAPGCQLCHAPLWLAR